MICGDIAVALIVVCGFLTAIITVCYTLYKYHTRVLDDKRQSQLWAHELRMLEETNRTPRGI